MDESAALRVRGDAYQEATHRARVARRQRDRCLEGPAGRVSVTLVLIQLSPFQPGCAFITPSLTANLGRIGAGRSQVATWLMTSSLQGKFIDYSATFENTDDLGDKRVSLIDSVEIHELIHAVRSRSVFSTASVDYLPHTFAAYHMFGHQALLPKNKCIDFFKRGLAEGLIMMSYTPRVRIHPPLILSVEQAHSALEIIDAVLEQFEAE